METFAGPKPLVLDPNYSKEKLRILSGLKDDMIDSPIIGVINALNSLPYCFTLQSCYGHFLYDTQADSHNIAPLPVTDRIPQVTYKIAYIAVCVENSKEGKSLLEDFQQITALDPENIQFGSPEWFWNRDLNSYALQVEPERFKDKDRVVLDYKEALHIERIRNMFFNELKNFLGI